MKLKTVIIMLFCAAFMQAQDLSSGLQVVNDLGNYPMQNVSKPAYLDSYVDPSFGTTIRRISNVGNGGTVKPMYSTIQAWNADESYMILYERNAGHQLLNGMTYEFIRYLDDIRPDDIEQIFWDFDDPNIFYYLESGSDDFIRYNVNTSTKEVIVNLDDITTNCNGSISMGNDVQMMSWDSDVIGFRCNNDRVYSYTISTGALREFNVDNVNYTAPMPGPSGDRFYHRRDIYGANGNYQRRLNESNIEHSCIGKLANGDDGHFAVAFSAAPNGSCMGNIVQHNMRTGACTPLISEDQGYPYPKSGTHISALAHKNTQGGWVAASMVGFQEDGQSLLDQELVLARADAQGNVTVCRIGHHRSDENEFDYFGEPHASISPTGTRVIFASDWSGSQDGQSIDTYVVELPSFNSSFSCNDGIRNGSETGIDCGGNCSPCPTNDYCTAQGSDTDYEYIQNVTVAGINNTSSGNNGGYTDFTAQVGTVSAGETYAINLTPGFPGTIYNENWRVWIDFNRDGDFTDSGEQLLSESGNSTINSSITIPSSVSSGTTRMRVSMKWNGTPTPCETFDYGEIEDYSISIGGANCNVGASCNDNNTCTVSDVYDANCNCIGTFLDSDNDGICNANDECPNDPNNTCNNSSYCTSQGNDTSREYIERITFAGIDNTSGNDGGYADYTVQVANINAGQEHAISLAPGFTGNKRNVTWRVWIDFNQDGDFDDSRERVIMQAGNHTINVNIYVPVSSIALSGQTRMRVSMKYGVAPDICETFQYGEVEDYTVNISNGNKIADETALNIRNYPNPFNDYANIEFNILKDSPVTLKIYDLTGRQITTLLDNELKIAGEHRIRFDGSEHPSGMYIYTLQVGEYTATGKMNIIK